MRYYLRYITMVCCLVLMMLNGCSSIRLEKAHSPKNSDWLQYGGNPGRTNASPTTLHPPLTVAWTYDASAGYSESAVTIADSVVYIATLQGEVFALNIQTGEKLGKYDFGKAVIGSPVIDSNGIYVAVANTHESLVGYDIVRGKAQWGKPLGGIETSPLLMGGRLYTTTITGEAYCIDKATGATIWKFLAPAFDRTEYIHSSPAGDGNTIVFGCDDGTVFCVRANDGGLRWSAQTGKAITGSPSISDGKVFVGSQDGLMYAFDDSTGKILWKTPLDAKLYSSQAVDSGSIYIGTSGGELISLDKNTGDIRWRYKTGSVVSAPPFLSGTILYFGSLDKTLYALESATGKLVWSYKTNGRIKSMPVAWNDYLLVPLDNRQILAFKQEAGK